MSRFGIEFRARRICSTTGSPRGERSRWPSQSWKRRCSGRTRLLLANSLNLNDLEALCSARAIEHGNIASAEAEWQTVYACAVNNLAWSLKLGHDQDFALRTVITNLESTQRQTYSDKNQQYRNIANPHRDACNEVIKLMESAMTTKALTRLQHDREISRRPKKRTTITLKEKT